MPEPLWINYDPVSATPQYDANELRQAMALALMYGGRAVGARQGVRPGGNQLQVSLAGSTITVQPGVYCIDPGLTTTQGPYWVAIPVPENPAGGSLAAADATNPRRDIVVARVYDHDQDASGLRLARSEYRAGVAGPTPSLPAVQAGELLLATIDVPKVGNGAPVVTNVYAYTVASGGILPVRAAGDIAAAVAGRYRDRLDTGVLERDNAATWETVADPNVFKAWTDYSGSFAIAAAVTAPTKGNSTYAARYKRIGKTVHYSFYVAIGSTFVAGSGAYLFPLPVPAVTSVLSAGAAYMLDSGVAHRAGTIAIINANQASIYRPDQGSELGSAGPGSAWKAGSTIKTSITYEAA